MTFRTLLTASLLSGLLPLTGHAQTAPATSRFYVGVGANLLTNVPFKDQGIVPRLGGPALTAGMQLTPRLAVQTGLSYHWKKDSYQDAYIVGTGLPLLTTSTYRVNYFLVPVLLRYTVTAPAERLHFDALGGVTLLHATARSTTDGTYGTSPYHEEYSNADTRASLTLGPAVRYTLSPQLELTANGLVSATLGDTYYEFSDRLFLNVAVGVNYTFGQR